MQTQRRSLLLALVFVLFGWAAYRGLLHLQDASLRASCRPQTILNVCEAYAELHEGLFPPLSPVPGMLFHDPAICEEAGCLGPDNLCESDLQGREPTFWEAMYRQPRNDWSYVYLGYVVESEAEFLAFAKAYRNRMALGLGFDPDLTSGTGPNAAPPLRRLQSLAALRAAGDPLADRAHAVPVVIEWPENHLNPGGHVVYLDGHREFVPYPGKFPMTPAILAELRALDNFAPFSPYL
jgi:hypothetical protein